jgi:hypothetical protein
MHFSDLKSLITVWPLFIIALFSSCSDLGTNPDEKDGNNTSDVISYSADIQPIFNRNCGNNCHLNNTSGGLSLSSYSGLMAGGNHGNVVISGDSEGSIIVKKLSSNPPFGDQMPKGGSALSAAKIELITAWIDAGAEYN